MTLCGKCDKDITKSVEHLGTEAIEIHVMLHQREELLGACLDASTALGEIISSGTLPEPALTGVQNVLADLTAALHIHPEPEDGGVNDTANDA